MSGVEEGAAGGVAGTAPAAESAACCREERFERMARETELFEELAHDIGTSLSPETVFRRIVATARELCRSDFAQLAHRDVETGAFVLRYWVGARLEHPPLPIESGRGLLGEVLATGAACRTDDYLADPRFAADVTGLAGAEGTVAELAVPIRTEGRVEGVLAVANPSRRPFDDRDQARLERLANRAVAALRNARLHTAMASYAQQVALINRLMGRLSATLGRARIQEAILEAVLELYPGGAVRLWLRDAEDPTLMRMAASAGLRDPQGGTTLRMRVGEGLLGEAAGEKTPVTSPDVCRDERFVNKAWARAEGLVSMLAAPIVYGERVLGVLAVATRAPKAFSLAEIELFQTLASHAAVALENAELYAAVQRQAAELEARVRDRTAELEKALSAKVEFLARMSHELRTPLNFIIGFSDLLRDGTGGPLTEKQARHIERIGSGGRHLLRLVEDLLELSTTEAGRGLRLETFRLGPAVAEMLEMLRAPIDRKGIAFHLEIPSDLTLVADRRKLGQVILNLAGNAVKFTPAGGSVRISARAMCDSPKEDPGSESHIPNADARNALQESPPGGGVEIVVADTGIGIAPENLERIFLGFEQVDGSATREYEGTGIGLALVRALVQLHGGRVWAESPGPGQGARFVVRLPRLQALARKRIVLVEDHAAVAEPLARRLEAEGYLVRTESTGAGALDVVSAFAPDVVILDIALPDLSGWEVLRTVRAGKSETLRTLVLTGLTGEEPERAGALGADAYLVKPVSADVVVETVRSLLAKQ